MPTLASDRLHRGAATLGGDHLARATGLGSFPVCADITLKRPSARLRGAWPFMGDRQLAVARAGERALRVGVAPEVPAALRVQLVGVARLGGGAGVHLRVQHDDAVGLGPAVVAGAGDKLAARRPPAWALRALALLASMEDHVQPAASAASLAGRRHVQPAAVVQAVETGARADGCGVSSANGAGGCGGGGR